MTEIDERMAGELGCESQSDCEAQARGGLLRGQRSG